MTTKPAGARAGRVPASSGVVLLVLGALVALGPLSIDAYLPGLPQLAADLGSSPSTAQVTVTTCLAGLALGQLVAGPLSDAAGRRRPLLWGLAVYTAAAFACALAPSAGWLVLTRGVQGLGGAFALVIAYACVRDGHEGAEAASTFSALLLVAGLAPVLAPLAGAQVLRISDWRGVFVALGVLGGAAFVASAAALPETLPAERRRQGGLRVTGAVYARLLKDRTLVGHALVNALVFSAMFAYISGSPFILQTGYGLSPQQYSAAFAVNALGLVAAAQVSGRLVRRVDTRQLLRTGVAAATAGGLGVLVVVTTGAGLWPLLGAFFVLVTSVGLVLPTAAALALERHGAQAGAAAALLGFAQWSLGGVTAPLAGVGAPGDALPTAVVIAVLVVAATATLVILAGPHAKATPA